MSVLMKLKWKKKKKENYRYPSSDKILKCYLPIYVSASLLIVDFFLLKWTSLAQTESYAKFFQVYTAILTPKLAVQDDL